MTHPLDKEAKRLGVPRQSIIKVWVAIYSPFLSQNLKSDVKLNMDRSTHPMIFLPLPNGSVGRHFSSSLSSFSKGNMTTYTKSPLRHGYANRILTIDLGAGTVTTPELDSEVRDYFIGGRGLGLYLLHSMIKPDTVASDPDNPLILANGPLCGVPQFPGAAKAMAVSLSPLTGNPGVSNFGGYFPAYLKFAGFDALVITGKAGRDTMIVIDGFKQEIRIEEAPDPEEVFLLEKVIAERFEKEGYQKRNIAFMTTAIGSEHTTYGCINSHYYDVTKPTPEGRGIYRTKQAGRTGMGSVMAGKKVRAIVVLADHPQGENPLGAADWDRVKQAGTALRKVIKEVDPHSLKMYRKGSAGLITFMNKGDYKSLPVNNFQAGSDPRAPQICGKVYAENLFEHRGMDGCFPGCNLQCTKGGWVTLTSGAHKGEKVWVDGPEYETAAGFGSNLGIYNPEFILEANWHCDNYAIDIISMATLMAFLMECFQRGYLTREDAEGLELTWGNEADALEFLHRVAHGKTAMAQVAGRSMTELKNWVADQYEKKSGQDTRPDLALFDERTPLLLLPHPSLRFHAGLLRRCQRHRRPPRRRVADQGRSAGGLPHLRRQGKSPDHVPQGSPRQRQPGGLQTAVGGRGQPGIAAGADL